MELPNVKKAEGYQNSEIENKLIKKQLGALDDSLWTTDSYGVFNGGMPYLKAFYW